MPAALNIFKVRNEDDTNRVLPDKKYAQEFHHAVAQSMLSGIMFRKEI